MVDLEKEQEKIKKRNIYRETLLLTTKRMMIFSIVVIFIIFIFLSLSNNMVIENSINFNILSAILFYFSFLISFSFIITGFSKKLDKKYKKKSIKIGIQLLIMNALLCFIAFGGLY